MEALTDLQHLHDTLKFIPQHIREYKFASLDEFPLLPNQFAYIIDISQGLITEHRGFEQVLGYTQDEVTLSLLYNLYHPDEAEMMYRIVARAWEYLCSTPMKKAEALFSIDYRFRKVDGSYIRVLRNSYNLDVDANGRTITTLSICTDITSHKLSGKIQWSLTGPRADQVTFEDILKLKANPLKLSKREIEILKLLAQGKTSTQVAKQLSTSAHTVNTHRRNMLHRNNIKNMTMLIAIAIQEGILQE